VNASPEAWSSHVARFHDKSNAPNLKLQFKVEDNSHIKEMCTGKRSRPISPNSLHEPSKKPRYDAGQKPKILHEEKEEISSTKRRLTLNIFLKKKKEVPMILIMARSFMCRAGTIWMNNCMQR
jgi:hypothetical protein